MRRIQAPGIEVNEIDRSQYNVQDYSLQNAPYCYICGFSDKGENYTTKWINTKNTLIETYGAPTTEYERYFYNGCMEILNNGGVCLASKLPYDNAELDKYTYCDYVVEDRIHRIGTKLEIDEVYKTVGDIYVVLLKLIDNIYFDDCRDELYSTYNLYNNPKIVDLKNCIENIYARDNIPTEISQNLGEIVVQLHELIQHISKLNQKTYFYFRLLDPELTSYLQISANPEDSGKITLEQYDDLKVGNVSLLQNKIRIVDISRSNYSTVDTHCVSSYMYDEDYETSAWIKTDDCLGIFPVITTSMNAMYFQKLLKDVADYNELSIELYNPLSCLKTVQSEFQQSKQLVVDLDFLNEDSTNLVIPMHADTIDKQSVSKIAASKFPNIGFKNQNNVETDDLKKIGIVVFKAYKDAANRNQVNFELLESFIGSLDRNDKDQTTKSSTFIDNVVNTNSRYINVFSNVNPLVLRQTCLLLTKNQQSTMLGFYEKDREKKITLQNSILKPLNKIFSKISDANQMPIDILVDAGVSNIAQYVVSKNKSASKKDFIWKLEKLEDTTTWLQVANKYDEFCKYTRRDCMYIADGLRTFCLVNNQKIVRDSDPTSSVDASILPKLRYIAALNSSYSAGYCNWFYINDDYSNDLFWCPPSIKAVGVYIYCDTYHHTWSAPAGLNRGTLKNVVDVAFSPTNDEAGKLYNQSWNYAVSYPIDGIIQEGQKTFQKNKTALDRVNVRRLMLYLEKQVVRIARRFLYEGNTAYLRQRFVDTIVPIFENAKIGNGISEYAIKCDDELNTTHVIENHELRCKIAVKPIKTLEFLVLDFVVTNQSASVNEEVNR